MLISSILFSNLKFTYFVVVRVHCSTTWQLNQMSFWPYGEVKTQNRLDFVIYALFSNFSIENYAFITSRPIHQLFNALKFGFRPEWHWFEQQPLRILVKNKTLNLNRKKKGEDHIKIRFKQTFKTSNETKGWTCFSQWRVDEIWVDKIW